MPILTIGHVTSLMFLLSSASAFLLPRSFLELFTQSSHLSCGLPRFLEPPRFFIRDIFDYLSSFPTPNPSHPSLILPTVQALLSTSSIRTFILLIFSLSSPCPVVLTSLHIIKAKIYAISSDTHQLHYILISTTL